MAYGVVMSRKSIQYCNDENRCKWILLYLAMVQQLLSVQDFNWLAPQHGRSQHLSARGQRGAEGRAWGASINLTKNGKITIYPVVRSACHLSQWTYSILSVFSGVFYRRTGGSRNLVWGAKSPPLLSPPYAPSFTRPCPPQSPLPHPTLPFLHSPLPSPEPHRSPFPPCPFFLFPSPSSPFSP